MAILVIDQFIGEYAFLSNFYLSRVIFEEYIYRSAEHAYQAAKSLEPEVRVEIQGASSPAEARKLGRMLRLRSDWGDVRLPTMLSIVRSKFEIEPLRTWLANTYPSRLVEGNRWGDTYWGVCDGIGQNKLGRILMIVRGEGGEAVPF